MLSAISACRAFANEVPSPTTSNPARLARLFGECLTRLAGPGTALLARDALDTPETPDYRRIADIAAATAVSLASLVIR